MDKELVEDGCRHHRQLKVDQGHTSLERHLEIHVEPVLNEVLHDNPISPIPVLVVVLPHCICKAHPIMLQHRDDVLQCFHFCVRDKRALEWRKRAPILSIEHLEIASLANISDVTILSRASMVQ